MKKCKRICAVFLLIIITAITAQVLPGCKNTHTPIPIDTSQLVINILDVGQGDSLYIQFPNGETMLIDAGERKNSKDIIDFIKENGDELTYVVATHPHSDHIGGMENVMAACDVKNVFMPRGLHTTKAFENLLDAIDRKGLSIQTAKAGKTIFNYGDIKAEFIAPNKDKYEDINNYSAVILLTYGHKKFLFMGDAEQESETEMISRGYDLNADVIKVGHHGSDTSTSKMFIEKVCPSLALISVGKDNNYKHPSAAVMSRLHDLNIDIWRTDEKGTIVMTCDGERITVQ